MQGHLKAGWRYKPAENAWANCTPMSLARSGLAAVAAGPYIFVMGGYPVTGQVARYDPRTHTWRDCPQMPTARQYLAAAVLPAQDGDHDVAEGAGWSAGDADAKDDEGDIM